SNKVTLNWTVADNEIANNFEIERSFNGRDFTTVGVVIASEKMGTEKYMFYETVSGTDKVMYRLKMIDKNHEVDYSRILIFQLKSTIANNIKIIGNPVNDKLTFSYTSPATQMVDVKVYDMSGRIVVSNKVNSLEGSNVISLPLSSTFKAGMYVVEVNNGTELQSSKFVKQYP
ncbi:MAG: T9SS type A sorting domain-containing protein, partial [Nitrososphaerales archaeon]